MAILLSDNIQTNAPKPSDSRYLNITVPYASCSQVNTCLVGGVRYTGLTVNIAGVEYWYKNGIADSCLILKSASSSGGTGTITGGTNGLSTSGANIKLGGVLIQNTTICGNGLYDLCLTALKNFNVAFSGSTITDSNISPKGLQYAGNYCATYVARSIVDAAYVTGKTSTSGIQTANNGLCKQGTNVRLGGVLTGNTTIDGNAGTYDLCLINLNAFNLGFDSVSIITDSGANGGLRYAADYSANFINRSLVDAAYVTGKTTTSGVQTVNNGLTKSGTNAVLGGTLTGSTTISGTQLLTLGDLNGITLSTANDTDIGLNAKSCGGIYIKSQKGTCPTGSDFCNAVGISVNVNSLSGFAIYDNRTGTTQTGIVYAGDYSANYVARSLVDKAYVDSVASGFDIHQAVVAATTSGITLSGSPKYIDGVYLTDGMRVLVKNQGIGNTGSTANGIYVVTGGTWQRATDYDNSHFSGETGTDLIPVTSGLTQNSSIWALVTPIPIIIGITPLEFTEFSTVIDVVAGQGIAVTQVGGVHTVCVQLSPGVSGLCFDGNGLELDYTIFTSGLTSASCRVYINASQSAISGTEIPVKFNAGCCLVVDSCNISTLSEFTITGNSSNTGFTVTHNKNKTFVNVQIVKNTSPYSTIYTYVSRPTVNTVCVTFDTAPTTGQQYKILITS